MLVLRVGTGLGECFRRHHLGSDLYFLTEDGQLQFKLLSRLLENVANKAPRPLQNQHRSQQCRQDRWLLLHLWTDVQRQFSSQGEMTANFQRPTCADARAQHVRPHKSLQGNADGGCPTMSPLSTRLLLTHKKSPTHTHNITQDAYQSTPVSPLRMSIRHPLLLISQAPAPLCFA